MLLTLPNEIIAIIVDCLRNRLCVPLAATCHRLHDIALRKLYRRVYLDDFNIVVFLQSIYQKTIGPTFAERCLMIRSMSIVVRDPVFIARANPHLCSVLRSASNLNKFSASANGFSGKILYIFLCRSGVLHRKGAPTISALSPLSVGPSMGTPFLNNLLHLHVGSSVALFKMAIGRKLQSISVSQVHHLRVETIILAIGWISDADGRYISLRKLSFSMVVDSPQDILRVTEVLFSVCENLDDLAIAVRCMPEPVRSIGMIVLETAHILISGRASHIRGRSMLASSSMRQ